MTEGRDRYLDNDSKSSDTYKVKAGDTLSKIAIQNKIQLAELIKLQGNGFDANKLRIGQEIRLPKKAVAVYNDAHIQNALRSIAERETRSAGEEATLSGADIDGYGWPPVLPESKDTSGVNIETATLNMVQQLNREDLKKGLPGYPLKNENEDKNYTGKGTLIYKNASGQETIIAGSFDNGKVVGKAIVWNDGHGKGVITYNNGAITNMDYEFQNGNTYTGGIKDNKYDGKGKYIDVVNGKVIEGEWLAGKLLPNQKQLLTEINTAIDEQGVSERINAMNAEDFLMSRYFRIRGKEILLDTSGKYGNIQTTVKSYIAKSIPGGKDGSDITITKVEKIPFVADGIHIFYSTGDGKTGVIERIPQGVRVKHDYIPIRHESIRL